MVRFTYKYLKPVALFLAVTFLFQCCKVYDKQPVTIEQAMTKTSIKIITTDSRHIYFDKIYYKQDGLLYGTIENNKSDKIETIIPKESIKEIRLYNERKSRILKTVVVLSVIGGFIGLFYLTYDPHYF